MLTSSFISQLIICNVEEEEQQVRAAKVMRPKRPTMETTDNHQSRSIGDMHSFLNASNNQQYNLLTFCRREAPAEFGSGPFKSTIADILDVHNAADNDK
jgi:hypothetical protein